MARRADAAPSSRPDSVASDGALTVTQALTVAKRSLKAITVTVAGEVSEVSDKPGYKAVYFTLRDEGSAMPCLMWHNLYEGCGVRLSQGMLVEATGTFDVYTAKGRMNFSARRLRLAGEGDLRMRVAALARKLQREGLMDVSRKRPLPALPSRVAVVTSPRGKAVHDCLRTLRRRYPLAEVYVCGVPVEGDAAPAALVEGLACAERSGAEVILLVRGGGSYEDLMPFNDERLARAIAACGVPVVTGIGHEPDNSIADMVADRRCSTPTAAAEAVVPSRDELASQLDRQGARLAKGLRRNVERQSFTLERLASQPLFRDPSYLFGDGWVTLDLLSDRLSRALPDMLSRDASRVDLAAVGLVRSRDVLFERQRQRVDLAERGLARSRVPLFEHFGQKVALYASRLQDLSPLNVLSRGYALAYDGQGRHVVDSVDEVAVGDALKISLSDGDVDCSVTSVSRREEMG